MNAKQLFNKTKTEQIKQSADKRKTALQTVNPLRFYTLYEIITQLRERQQGKPLRKHRTRCTRQR